MGLVTEIRLRSRHIVPPVIAISLLAYFAYHAFHGERGLFAWQALKQDLAAAELQEAAFARHREEFKHRVSLLHPEHLDPDMLEERARLLLNYGHADDYVVLLGR